ncbi:glucosyl hydrolase [Bradyrhizobium sp.]|jgi:predicted GH43/DUF377 family glycosyl hydrolase|uniref:glucosyl hydrolase n=1 Tax=Bradyrhizobium sp. TaxID=376 RepID=UPI002DDD5C4C|nr:glucosyl hydrolase [Bradyrhizobium sp.]HEV2159811.1 glucosyl hydrolase [Bradyrhizobium sp.]
MKWLKHGVVWKPSGIQWWARSHATCPTPIWLDNETLRVYVQCRDEKNVGRIGFVDLDPVDPRKVIRESQAPVFDIGLPGAFDDNGVFPTSVVRVADGSLYMYYVGFELCHRIRYRLLTGLAISTDNGNTFRRAQATPVLERSSDEQFFRCGPWVEQDGQRFRMWYVAGNEWETIDGKPMPIYDIRYAESDDGVHWPAKGHIVMPLESENEHGFGRPVVRRRRDEYRMFYSIRRRNPARYRLGYAKSRDGQTWQRLDGEMGLDVTAGSWDGEAISYGVDVDAGGRTWLLYNGDDFGVTGFGIAELLQP